MERCVVDTSVLISKRLDAALQCAERYVTSAVLLEYMTWARRSAEEAAEPRRRGYIRLLQLLPSLLRQLDIRVVDGVAAEDVDDAVRWALERGVNPGDALISAAARRLGAVVITRDRDWERLPEVKSVILP
ncbi:MAG: PIN domain-containing protein [Thermoproteus sp.]